MMYYKNTDFRCVIESIALQERQHWRHIKNVLKEFPPWMQYINCITRKPILVCFSKCCIYKNTNLGCFIFNVVLKKKKQSWMCYIKCCIYKNTNLDVLY